MVDKLASIGYDTGIADDTVALPGRSDGSALSGEFKDLQRNIARVTEPIGPDTISIGPEIKQLSSNGTKTCPLLIGSRRIGSIVRCESVPGWASKAMFMSCTRSGVFFDTDQDGNVFPNIDRITEYFKGLSTEDGKTRKITMISTGPTFDKYGGLALTGLNYDNGKQVGTGTKLTDTTTADKGIVIITGGKITFSHTQEMTSSEVDGRIAKQADIMTMSSLKRNDKLNMSAALRAHRYAHALVQFNDGARGELILNNCTSLEKQNVMKALTISRAVYADADAHDNYLDGIRFFVSPTGDGKGHLQYSHPTTGDLFLDENVKQGEVVKDHMPGIIIQYIIQD